MKVPHRLLVSFFALAVAAVVLGGCNTVEGFGKDTKKLGEKLEDSAARNK